MALESCAHNYPSSHTLPCAPLQFETFLQYFSLLYVYFLYPMSPVALCASIYMTLAITVERYLAVCKPILYR